MLVRSKTRRSRIAGPPIESSCLRPTGLAASLVHDLCAAWYAAQSPPWLRFDPAPRLVEDRARRGCRVGRRQSVPGPQSRPRARAALRAARLFAGNGARRGSSHFRRSAQSAFVGPLVRRGLPACPARCHYLVVNSLRTCSRVVRGRRPHHCGGARRVWNDGSNTPPDAIRLPREAYCSHASGGRESQGAWRLPMGRACHDVSHSSRRLRPAHWLITPRASSRATAPMRP